MTSEHVGKQTNCQRERTHEERRDELDRRHEDVERPGHPRREERVLEISEALVLEANADEDNPNEQRKEEWERHSSSCWHLNDRNNSRNVAEVDKREKAEKEWCPPEAVAPIVGMPIWFSMNSTIASRGFELP